MKIIESTETKPSPAPQVKFPALYRHKHENFVVLFTDFSEGVVVDDAGGMAYGIGYQYLYWYPCTSAECWEPVSSLIVKSATQPTPKTRPLTFGDVKVGQVFESGGCLYKRHVNSHAADLHQHLTISISPEETVSAIYPDATLDLGPAVKEATV